MKTLERFWQWVDTETPYVSDVMAKATENLSEGAAYALDEAVSYIADRALGTDEEEDAPMEWALGTYPHVLRDLSLDLCRALEKMEALVPKAEPAPEPEPRRPWWESTHEIDAAVYSLAGVTAMHAGRRSGRMHDMRAMFSGEWPEFIVYREPEAASHPAAPEASSPDGSAPAGSGPK